MDKIFVFAVLCLARQAATTTAASYCYDVRGSDFSLACLFENCTAAGCEGATDCGVDTTADYSTVREAQLACETAKAIPGTTSVATEFTQCQAIFTVNYVAPMLSSLGPIILGKNSNGVSVALHPGQFRVGVNVHACDADGNLEAAPRYVGESSLTDFYDQGEELSITIVVFDTRQLENAPATLDTNFAPVVASITVSPLNLKPGEEATISTIGMEVNRDDGISAMNFAVHDTAVCKNPASGDCVPVLEERNVFDDMEQKKELNWRFSLSNSMFDAYTKVDVAATPAKYEWKGRGSGLGNNRTQDRPNWEGIAAPAPDASTPGARCGREGDPNAYPPVLVIEETFTDVTACEILCEQNAALCTAVSWCNSGAATEGACGEFENRCWLFANSEANIAELEEFIKIEYDIRYRSAHFGSVCDGVCGIVSGTGAQQDLYSCKSLTVPAATASWCADSPLANSDYDVTDEDDPDATCELACTDWTGADCAYYGILKTIEQGQVKTKCTFWETCDNVTAWPSVELPGWKAESACMPDIVVGNYLGNSTANSSAGCMEFCKEKGARCCSTEAGLPGKTAPFKCEAYGHNMIGEKITDGAYMVHTMPNFESPYERCTGECTATIDCAAGLECFKRRKGEPIPGCTGDGRADDAGYCYDPEAGAVHRANPSRSANGAAGQDLLGTVTVYEAQTAEAQLSGFGGVPFYLDQLATVNLGFILVTQPTVAAIVGADQSLTARAVPCAVDFVDLSIWRIEDLACPLNYPYRGGKYCYNKEGYETGTPNFLTNGYGTCDSWCADESISSICPNATATATWPPCAAATATNTDRLCSDVDRTCDTLAGSTQGTLAPVCPPDYPYTSLINTSGICYNDTDYDGGVVLGSFVPQAKMKFVVEANSGDDDVYCGGAPGMKEHGSFNDVTEADAFYNALDTVNNVETCKNACSQSYIPGGVKGCKVACTAASSLGACYSASKADVECNMEHGVVFNAETQQQRCACTRYTCSATEWHSTNAEFVRYVPTATNYSATCESAAKALGKDTDNGMKEQTLTDTDTVEACYRLSKSDGECNMEHGVVYAKAEGCHCFTTTCHSVEKWMDWHNRDYFSRYGLEAAAGNTCAAGNLDSATTPAIMRLKVLDSDFTIAPERGYIEKHTLVVDGIENANLSYVSASQTHELNHTGCADLPGGCKFMECTCTPDDARPGYCTELQVEEGQTDGASTWTLRWDPWAGVNSSTAALYGTTYCHLKLRFIDNSGTLGDWPGDYVKDKLGITSETLTILLEATPGVTAAVNLPARATRFYATNTKVDLDDVDASKVTSYYVHIEDDAAGTEATLVRMDSGSYLPFEVEVAHATNLGDGDAQGLAGQECPTTSATSATVTDTECPDTVGNVTVQQTDWLFTTQTCGPALGCDLTWKLNVTTAVSLGHMIGTPGATNEVYLRLKDKGGVEVFVQMPSVRIETGRKRLARRDDGEPLRTGQFNIAVDGNGRLTASEAAPFLVVPTGESNAGNDALEPDAAANVTNGDGDRDRDGNGNGGGDQDVGTNNNPDADARDAGADSLLGNKWALIPVIAAFVALLTSIVGLVVVCSNQRSAHRARAKVHPMSAEAINLA